MKAFVYPGQASQYVGMAKDFYEKFPQARAMFDTASSLLGYSLTDVCFDGPEEQLKQTSITQPAIFVHSCVISCLLAERNLKPDMVAGHSLGEYSALFAAGVLRFDDAVSLVKARAEAMHEAGQKNPGTMAALIGLETEAATKLCERAAAAGIVCPANFNSPGQIVISGSKIGVAEALRLAPEFGARKAVELVVSGAFHSPLMAPASDKLRSAIATTNFRDAAVPIYANVIAKPATKADEIKRLLDQQLVSPVLWAQSIECMVRDGAQEFFEIGPGKVLTGLLRRIDKNLSSRSVDTVADFESL